MYDPEEQLNFTQERWENSLNKTYTEYYASYLHEDSTLTSIDARIKAIDVAYANADGFDLCVVSLKSIFPLLSCQVQVLLTLLKFIWMICSFSQQHTLNLPQ